MNVKISRKIENQNQRKQQTMLSTLRIQSLLRKRTEMQKINSMKNRQNKMQDLRSSLLNGKTNRHLLIQFAKTIRSWKEKVTRKDLILPQHLHGTRMTCSLPLHGVLIWTHGSRLTIVKLELPLLQIERWQQMSWRQSSRRMRLLKLNLWKLRGKLKRELKFKTRTDKNFRKYRKLLMRL